MTKLNIKMYGICSVKTKNSSYRRVFVVLIQLMFELIFDKMSLYDKSIELNHL